MIKIYTQFIRERIAKLRTQENISARELGFRLGQSGGYINSIENGNSLPSLRGFLNICEYFQITPHEFFNEESMVRASFAAENTFEEIDIFINALNEILEDKND